MPWKPPSLDATKEALTGCNAVVKRNYKTNFTAKERKFMERLFLENDRYFKPITIVGEADWLSNHDETGQTFESFWRSYATGESPATIQNDGGRPARPKTASAAAPPPRFTGLKRSSERSKTICILQLGPFPGDEAKADKSALPNEFMIWMKTYCTAFFYSAKVSVLPPISIAEVACHYRVNQITGRYQLKAADILKYLHKVKPKSADCLIAVTMTDLYPKANWDFVFGLASTNTSGEFGGVGVFSFSRYDDVFYETWTQGTDEMKRFSGGELDYSVFDKPPKYVNGSNIPITDILLLRACRVMTHEVGHMFGLKHCIWSRCLMNGSNHIQESDLRPPFLCSVCLRKLQVVLGFDLLERYQAMKNWASTEFWLKFKYCPEENNLSLTSKVSSRPVWERRTSLPVVVTRPKTASASRMKQSTSKRPVSSKSLSTTIVSHRPSSAVVLPTKKSYFEVKMPPLGEFQEFRNWLTDAEEALTSAA